MRKFTYIIFLSFIFFMQGCISTLHESLAHDKVNLICIYGLGPENSQGNTGLTELTKIINSNFPNINTIYLSPFDNVVFSNARSDDTIIFLGYSIGGAKSLELSKTLDGSHLILLDPVNSLFDSETPKLSDGVSSILIYREPRNFILNTFGLIYNDGSTFCETIDKNIKHEDITSDFQIRYLVMKRIYWILFNDPTIDMPEKHIYEDNFDKYNILTPINFIR